MKKFTHTAKLNILYTYSNTTRTKDVKIEKTDSGYEVYPTDYGHGGSDSYTFEGKRIGVFGEVTHDVSGCDYTLTNINPLEDEVSIILCEYCSVDLTDAEDTYKSEESDCLCEDCYVENNMTECGMCEEHVTNNDVCAEFILLNKEDAEELDMEPGFYKTEGIFFLSDGFSTTLCKDNLIYVKELDGEYDSSSNELCSCCRDTLRNTKIAA